MNKALAHLGGALAPSALNAAKQPKTLALALAVTVFCAALSMFAVKAVANGAAAVTCSCGGGDW